MQKQFGHVPLVGWGFLTAWGLVSLTLDYSPIPGGPALLNAVTSFASILGCAAVLMCALWRKADHSAAKQATSGSVSALVLGVGVSALSVLNQVALLTGRPAWVAVSAQVLASFAYISLMQRWFCAYARLDPQEIEAGAVWSTATCAAIYLLASLVPYPIALTLCEALPIASALCLMQVSSNTPENTQGQTARQTEKSTHRKASAAWAGGIAACSFVLSIAPNISLNLTVASHPQLLALSNMGGLALAALLALWYVTSTRRLNLASLFRMLAPLAGLGLFLSATPSAALCALGVAFTSAGSWALYAFAWMSAAELGNASRSQIALRFATARIAFDAGGGLAGLLGVALTALLPQTLNPTAPPSPAFYILFGATALLALVNALLPSGLGTNGQTMTIKNPNAAPASLDNLMEARAHLVSERFSLSDRESQILLRLLKGYSTASIRNELAIAKGTVDSHIQRIYRKCDVHGRQELVELVERCAQETTPE